MKVASGSISWSSGSTSAQTVSSILDGDTPDVVLFLSFFLDTVRGVASYSLGAATGTGTQRTHHTYHHTGATGAMGNYFRDDSIAGYTNGLTARNVAVSAWGAGTFTLTPSAAVPSNSNGRTYWIALSDVQADLRTLTLTSTGTTKQTTSFDTKAVIMGLRCGAATFGANVLQNNFAGAWGFFSETGGASYGWNGFGNAASPSNTGVRASRSGIPKFSAAALDAATINGYVTVPTWYSDGYDVNISVADTGNQSIIGWALALDCPAAILPFTVPSSTGAQALTGAGRQGQAAVVMLTPPASTADTRVDNLSFSVGFAAGGSQSMLRYQVPDATSSPTSSATTATDAVAGGQTGSTEDSRAAFTSFDADGVTLTWSDADATAGLGAVLVLGEQTSAAPSAGAIQYYRRLCGITATGGYTT